MFWSWNGATCTKRFPVYKSEKWSWKIEDQRLKIKIIWKDHHCWSLPPKRSRSPLVILKIKIKDRDLCPSLLAPFCSAVFQIKFGARRTSRKKNPQVSISQLWGANKSCWRVCAIFFRKLNRQATGQNLARKVSAASEMGLRGLVHHAFPVGDIYWKGKGLRICAIYRQSVKNCK